jgi:hypothetical protein
MMMMMVVVVVVVVIIIHLSFNPHIQLSGTALGYGLGDRGFESRQGLGTFLFTTFQPTSTRGSFPGDKAAGG